MRIRFTYSLNYNKGRAYKYGGTDFFTQEFYVLYQKTEKLFVDIIDTLAHRITGRL
jgi:hypothetical protein